jgi:hypothetical protein
MKFILKRTSGPITAKDCKILEALQIKYSLSDYYPDVLEIDIELVESLQRLSDLAGKLLFYLDFSYPFHVIEIYDAHRE